MSVNKKSEPGRWHICPSNSFPGRYYYFNTASGEAVWSLNDVEIPKKEMNIQRIPNYHNYPEPKTPPDDLNLSNTQTFKPTVKCTIDHFNAENMIWTPVQFTIQANIPVSCNVPIDKTVHAGQIPLCKRFKNFSNPTMVFDTKNIVITKDGAFRTSTPKKQPVFKMPELDVTCPVGQKNPVEIKTNQSSRETGHKTTDTKKSVFNVPNLKKLTPNRSFNLQNTASTSGFNAVISQKNPNFETCAPKNSNYDILTTSTESSPNKESKHKHYVTEKYESNSSKNNNQEIYKESVAPKSDKLDTYAPKSDNFDTYAPKSDNFDTYASYVPKKINVGGTYIPKNSNFGSTSINMQMNTPENVNLSNSDVSENFNTCITKTVNVQSNALKNADWDKHANKNDTYSLKKINFANETPKSIDWEAHAAKNFEPSAPMSSIFHRHTLKRSIFESCVPKFSENPVAKYSNFESCAPKSATATFVPKSSNNEILATKNSNFESHVPKSTNNETYGPKTMNHEMNLPKSSNFEIHANTPSFERHAPKSSIFESPDDSKTKTIQYKSEELEIHANTPTFERHAPKSSIFESPDDSKTKTIQYKSEEQVTPNSTLEFGNTVETDKHSLDRNDLRHLIIAKRRKSQNYDEIDAKKSRQDDSGITDTDETAQKRVRFDLGDNIASDYTLQDSIEKEVYPPSESRPMLPRNSLWYIITDTDILIDQFDYIEEIVTADPNCSLLIPYAVESELKILSTYECRGYQRIMNARHLIRKLPAKSFCTIEPPFQIDNTDTIDSIIKCCLRVINDGYYVVLITNNLKLYSRAKSSSILCFNLKEIKNGAKIKPKYNINNVKITVPNKLKENNILTDSILVHTYKKQLFTQNHTNDEQNCEKTINSNKIENFTTKQSYNSIFDQDLDNNLTAHEMYNNLEEKLPFKNVNNIKKLFDSDLNDSNSKTITEKSNIHIETNKSEFKIPQNPAKKPNASVLSKFSNENDENVPNLNFKARLPNLNLEASFSMLPVKNNDMFEKLAMRMDEWTCSYVQIMEDILNDIIQYTNCNKNILQYSVIDGLNVIKQYYKDKNELRMVIEKLYNLIVDCSSKKGQLKHDTKPEDFMQILSGSINLLQKLQHVLPNYERLYESEGYLNTLADSIETDEMDEQFDLNRLTCNSECDETMNRTNFVKDKNYVINYLKKHNKDWAMYYDGKEDDSYKDVPKTDTQDLKIIRTTGKNLNMYKIDNNKSIHRSKENLDAGPKGMVLRPVIDKEITKAGPKVDHAGLENPENTRPNIIRSLKPIDEYEDKLWTTTYKENTYLNNIKKSDRNLTKLNTKIDYLTEILSENVFQKTENLPSNAYNNKIQSYDNNNYYKDNIYYTKDNNKNETIEDSDDSGFENENTQAHSVIKMFLNELSSSFKVIYEFIEQFVKDINEHKVSDRRMKIVQEKSTKALENLGEITPSLRTIISRESAEVTVLKGWLLNAGVEATSDKRMVKYRQTVIKSLEQAIVLERALRIIASISQHDLDSNEMSLCTTNYRYINIFE